MSLVTWSIISDKTNVPALGQVTSSKEVEAKSFAYYENFKMSVKWDDAPSDSIILARLQVDATDDIDFITPKNLVSGTIYNLDNYRNIGTSNTIEFIYTNRESPKSSFYTFQFWAFQSVEDLQEFLALVAVSCEAPPTNQVRQAELIQEYRRFVIKINAVSSFINEDAPPTDLFDGTNIAVDTTTGFIDKSVVAGLRVLSLAEEAGLVDPPISDPTFDPPIEGGDPPEPDDFIPTLPDGTPFVGLDPSQGDPIRVGENLIVYIPTGSSVNGNGIIFLPIGRAIAKRYDRTQGVCTAHRSPRSTGGYIETACAEKTFCSTNDEPIALQGSIVRSDCGHIGYIDPNGSNNFIENREVARIYDSFSGTYSGYITGPGCPDCYGDDT